MDYAVVMVPAAPVRRKAMYRNEMVNQLLFGETVKLLKTKGNLWVKVSSQQDHYEGWMTGNMIQSLEEIPSVAASEWITTERMSLVTVNEKPMYVPVAHRFLVLGREKEPWVILVTG